MDRRQLIKRLGLISGAAAVALAPKDLYATSSITGLTGGGPMMYGGPSKGVFAGFFAEQILNATGQRVAAVFQAPKTGTLHHFGWRLQAVAQAPTNGLRFSFQDIASAFPDGTADQYANVTSGITAGAFLEPSDYMGSTGLGSGTKRSVTMGDWIGCVIDWVSFNASDSVTPSYFDWGSLAGVYDGGSQYNAKYNGSSWSSIDRDPPQIGLKYDDGTWAHICPYWYPITSITSNTYNSSSTPDERALLFQVPIAMRVVGCFFQGSLGSFNTIDLVLYDASNSVLATKTMQGGNSASNAFDVGARREMFTSAITIEPNVNYRLSVKPGADNAVMYDMTVPSSAHLGAIEGGTSFMLSTRTDAGAWTDTNTKRPLMGLLVDGFLTSSAGGGEVSHPFVG